MKRRPLTKKSRFEIFKRDQFTCVYCGSTPPAVTLEVDHVIPVSSGGENEIDNLVCSCFDCNRGKGKNNLDSIPETINEKAEYAKEREGQIKEYRKLIKRVRARKSRDVKAVNDVFKTYFEDRGLTDKFKRSIKYNFVEKIDVTDLTEYMHQSCNRFDDDPNRAISYFCGICWNRIKARSAY